MSFNLRATLESGQIFRWRIEEDGAWVCHGDKIFFLKNDGTSEDIPQNWLYTFLRNDQEELSHDHQYVTNSIQSLPGLRILRQDPWECLVTFIISQNNHQKRIQSNCFAVSKAFGKPIENGFHTFPKSHELGTEEQLRNLGLGYRASYIAALKNIDMKWLYGLSQLTYEEAHKELCTLKGIGPKVADCILLFSLGFDEACPEDTWIKKIFAQTGLSREILGPKAGLLQQFIFHYARSKSGPN